MQAHDKKTAEGVAEATAQNDERRFGVKVDGVWYDGWGKCPQVEGQPVRIAYRENGRFRDIQSLELTSESGISEVVYTRSNKGARRTTASPKPVDQHTADEDTRILRSVALKAAAQSVMSGDAATVLHTATTFYEWLSRPERG